jgi:acylphosphatase
MGSDLVRVRVFAGGRVQGVAYRFFAEKYAGRMGITGWTRNLPDGRVEVLAEASEENIEAFLERLREGPRLARVDGFEVRREAATGEFRDFQVVFLPD